MRTVQYRWLGVFIAIAMLLLAMTMFTNRRHPSRGIVISFQGYTNVANSPTRFALFSLQNQDTLSTRWRGNWVEVEGDPLNKAPVMTVKLPWFQGATLKEGGSLTVAVGEPAEEGRWRFNVVSSRYTARERALDFAVTHQLPLAIGRFWLLNPHQILSPTNFTTNCSVWLGR